MELFRATNFDFLKYKWYAIGASWLLIALGAFAIFVQKGLRFGIDFAGGTQIALRFAADARPGPAAGASPPGGVWGTRGSSASRSLPRTRS